MALTTIEQIKDSLDIAEVIGAYVPLKRSGRSFKGLCPFHAEKTPSFYVSPDRGSWHCFGCGEGGDIFTFVQKRENLDFAEALRMLASKAGVELPSRQSRPPEEQELEARLLAVLASAELYFRSALGGRAGEAARGYLERRGVNQESLDRFGLGYGPRSGLLHHLRQAGISLEDALAAGVLGRGEDGSVYELFRERVMFPIRDQAGRTIGFGGRTLGEAQPKYLNGPQTPLFDKSGCLFALDLARAEIRQAGRAVIVEGYLDAVIAHQHGNHNVVATLGTALTERHLDLLGRRASEIVLALDADAAGQAATFRGLEVARNARPDGVVPVVDPGVRGLIRYQAVRKSQIKILTMPSGQDPDEVIRADPAAWERLVSTAMPVVDFVLSRLGERFDLASASGRQQAVQESMAVIQDLANPIEQEHYLQRLAAIVKVHESALRSMLRRDRGRVAAVPGGERPLPAESTELPEAYALALAYLAGVPEPLQPSDMLGAEAQAIYHHLLDPRATDAAPGAAQLAELAAQADPSLQSALARVAQWLPRLEGLGAEERTRELEIATLKLRQRRLRERHQDVLELLVDPEPVDNASRLAALLASIASQLKDIEAALAARNGIGSLVWRSRHVGEVLGG